MKCKIPEISWHNRDPVLSIDINSKIGNPCKYRLASGGTDTHVLIWYINLATDGSDIDLDLVADLTRHQRAVNVVRWSPNGELLASGDDESVILIWKQRSETDVPNILDPTDDQNKEIWITLKVLRGHMEDIYDLSWAPNSEFLVSGSVDNSAIIWDVYKGKSQAILKEHKGFVQGVAWDPKNQYIATLSTDRHLRIFDIQTKRVLHRINKSTLAVPEEHELHGQRMRLFHDDTLQTFFRRLSFSPDGKLLLTPAGITDYDGVTHRIHTTYAFSRHAFRQPAIVLPCDQYTIAVRSCPLLFQLRPHNPSINPPVVPLPYRMIFAVATRSSLYFYDTQQKQPFALISNIHYTRLTDVAWSSDGRIVIVSSTDGFCSLITFESGELGEKYDETDTVLGSVLRDEKSISVAKKSKKKKVKKSGMQSQEVRQSPTTDEAAKEVDEKSRESSLDTMSEKGDKKMQNSHIESMAISADVNVNKEKVNMEEERCHAELFVKSVCVEHAQLRVPTATISAALIIDKEILSSEEKFESPEKSRPPTSIMVRRHPRTPTTFASGSSQQCAADKNNILSPLAVQGTSPCQTKRATPIATRRIPRALIVDPTPTGTTTLTEEAMDAWPSEIQPLSKQQVSPTKMTSAETANEKILPSETNSCHTENIRLFYEETVEDASSEQVKTTTIPTVAEQHPSYDMPTSGFSDVTSDRTEDIRLVYEETVENVPLENVEEKVAILDRNPNSPTNIKATPNTPKQEQLTPNSKTPRRITLTTISTPKSKQLVE